MRLRKLGIGFLLAGLLTSGCGRGFEGGLLVFAGAGLTDALQAQAARYLEMEGLPEDAIRFHFHSSDVCAAQIRQGAPADLFLSADERIVRRLIEEERVEAPTFTPLLRNRLVLIVPARGTSPIRSFADLQKTRWHRFAIGNPESVPAGRYGKEALESMGLWEHIEPGIIRAEHIRQAMLYVVRGEADAGIVYVSDAAVEEGVVVTEDVPADHTPDIIFAGGVIRTARHPGAARRFLEWLASDEAAGIWLEYGFIPIRPPRIPDSLPGG